MLTIEEARAQLDDYAGKTAALHIDNRLGAAWAHVPDHDTHIRFYDDLGFVVDTVIEYYQDYFEDKEGFIDDDSEWCHPTIIPFASVGGEASDDDDGFFSDSFAFLFWNLESGDILSATTDDWDFENLGPFEKLRPQLSAR